MKLYTIGSLIIDSYFHRVCTKVNALKSFTCAITQNSVIDAVLGMRV